MLTIHVGDKKSQHLLALNTYELWIWASSSRNRNRAVRFNLYPAMQREKDFNFHRSRALFYHQKSFSKRHFDQVRQRQRNLVNLV